MTINNHGNNKNNNKKNKKNDTDNENDNDNDNDNKHAHNGQLNSLTRLRALLVLHDRDNCSP
jgi:hypothetical protein